MPTLAFTLVLLGEYMLIMRSSVLEVFSEDYILTAKAKGLSTFQIITDHALRNAMLPMVTLDRASTSAFTVSGAIQVEDVFCWPGHRPARPWTRSASATTPCCRARSC